MSAAASHRTFLQAAVRHWRYFSLAWAVPVMLYLGGVLGLVNGTTFSLVLVPLFFAGQLLAYLPYRRRLIGYWALVFWAKLVPLLIWAALVFGVGLLGGSLAGA